MTFTREQIEAIDVGTRLAFSPVGVFTKSYEVVKITARDDDVHGKRYVLGYFRFTENSEMSFSIKEGSEVDATIYKLA
jgi:hypothetical protein